MNLNQENRNPWRVALFDRHNLHTQTKVHLEPQV
jgi:hypothetical protein